MLKAELKEIRDRRRKGGLIKEPALNIDPRLLVLEEIGLEPGDEAYIRAGILVPFEGAAQRSSGAAQHITMDTIENTANIFRKFFMTPFFFDDYTPKNTKSQAPL